MPKEINLIQGSEDWLEFRKGKISASMIAAIMGKCPFKSRLDAYLEIKGLKTQPVTTAMQRGRDLESVALETLENKTGLLFRPAVFQHDEYDWAIASLDGITLGNLIGASIAEIKCPGKSSFEKMKIHGVPISYEYQMQWQMFVTGIKKCHFFAWTEWDTYEVIIEEDFPLQQEMLAAAKEFMVLLENETPPDPEEEEAVFCDDEKFKDLEREYFNLDDEIKSLNVIKERIKLQLFDEFFDDIAVRGKFVIINRQSRKGSLDENKMREDGIDLTKYRKPTVTFPVIKLLKGE